MARAHRRYAFGANELRQPDRIKGEAILRLAKRTPAIETTHLVDALTGVESVDAILRAHRVRAVEPLPDTIGQTPYNHGATQLYKLITDSDEEVDSLIAELRDRPDVELIMPRYPVYTQSS